MAGSAYLGLCGGCTHGRGVRSAKGSVFLRCGLHDTDPRFPKYPRLPVTACPGFAPRDAPDRDRTRGADDIEGEEVRP